mmetsp:Transcript_44392/g.73643  ORF Transcript_44392/g.73643 Transcript_44392/m.73643 type:complete len:102 (+) Transcript_44392:25-330(+)
MVPALAMMFRSTLTARNSRMANVVVGAVRNGSHGGGGYGSGPYRGLKEPKVPAWHHHAATAWGTVAFLWFFWRCKIDGPKELYGMGWYLNQPHGDHDDHHH